GDLEFAVVEANPTDVVTQYSKPSSSLSVVTGMAYTLTARDTGGDLVSSFLEPITVTISYEIADIAGITESTLTIYRYDGSSWHELDACSVDTTAKTVTCTTTAFSTFAIFGDTVAAAQASSESVTAAVAHSSGTSASNRVSNLLSMGFYDLAKAVAVQYGINISPSGQAATVFQAPAISGLQPIVFTRTLKPGMIGNDVRDLQIFLNSQGFIVSSKGAGSPGHETTYFGPSTKAALIRYQNAYGDYILKPLGLKAGTGIFGKATREFVEGLKK
ncbi:MAG: peptidoglycan-binding domain-containing protein, partial [Candidatus Paceibacterota bacterium]